MPPNADHAIFAFRSREHGTYTIYASVVGQFVEKTVTVIDPTGSE